MKFFSSNLLIPSKKRWKRWSLPSKLTAIGAYCGIITFIIWLISISFGMFNSIPIDHSVFHIVVPRVQNEFIINEFDSCLIQVSSKHNEGYRIMESIISYTMENKEKIGFNNNTGIDLIEMSIWTWLAKKYHYHWQMEEITLNGISFNLTTGRLKEDAYKRTTEIYPEEIQIILEKNQFLFNILYEWGLSLPNGTKINTSRNGNERIIELSNREIKSFSIGVRHLLSCDIEKSELGKKIKISNLDSTEIVCDFFEVEIKCKYNKYRKMTKKFKDQKEWVNKTIVGLRNDFDWNSIKEDLGKCYKIKIISY